MQMRQRIRMWQVSSSTQKVVGQVVVTVESRESERKREKNASNFATQHCSDINLHIHAYISGKEWCPLPARTTVIFIINL